MNVRVLGDHVLVLLAPREQIEQSPSGLILAPALTPVMTHGRVMRIGPKVSDVQPGDVVAFPPETGIPMEIDGHECLFLRESDITATVAKREAVTA